MADKGTNTDTGTTTTRDVVNKAYTHKELEAMGDKGRVLRVVKTAYSIGSK